MHNSPSKWPFHGVTITNYLQVLGAHPPSRNSTWRQVVTSESYVRKTGFLEMSGERPAAMNYDVMDMWPSRHFGGPNIFPKRWHVGSWGKLPTDFGPVNFLLLYFGGEIWSIIFPRMAVEKSSHHHPRWLHDDSRCRWVAPLYKMPKSSRMCRTESDQSRALRGKEGSLGVAARDIRFSTVSICAIFVVLRKIRPLYVYIIL